MDFLKKKYYFQQTIDRQKEFELKNLLTQWVLQIILFFKHWTLLLKMLTLFDVFDRLQFAQPGNHLQNICETYTYIGKHPQPLVSICITV